MTSIKNQYEVARDPYETLEVRVDATLEEIRKSYRKLLLKAHPDKNPHRPEWSERRVRELFHAFELIGDAQKRNEFDARARARRRSTVGRRSPRRKPTEQDLFFFRKSDPESLALRVLYFLMHSRGQEAVELLFDQEDRLGTSFLEDQLDRSDFLDSFFLLGEYLMERKRYPEALQRFLKLYEKQGSPGHRRPHYDLAVDFLKSLYLRHLPRVLPPDELLLRLDEVPEALRWSQREISQLCLARAKAHQTLGDAPRAREWVKSACATDPQSSRARRWAERAGLGRCGGGA